MNKYSSHKKRNNLLLSGIVISLGLFVFSQSFAEEPSRIEYKIKAGYLYNFTKFITWPKNESETFNLCILGEDPFGSIINPIEKRTVKNKPIRLYRLQVADEVKHCHIVYLSPLFPENIYLPGVLTVSSRIPALTVSESKQFTEAGGMIAFFQRDGRVKLHINLEVLRRSGLEISAKLLEVAEIYEGESND
mgnify:CR=1 FL=1